jgi:predicted nucleic acid-binding protein
VVSVAYFDTSALLKRYVTEAGTEWVKSLLASLDAPVVLTSRLAVVEAACACARRAREGNLPPEALDNLLRLFEYDVAYRYHILELSPATIDAARDLALQYPLRAYDAVHLATAWLANQELVRTDKPPLTVVCADDRLVGIASATGLLTDNPHDHA